MLIRVFCVVSMLNKLPPGVCWRGGGATVLLNKGGGSNRLPALVTKQQAVQVQTSYNYYSIPMTTTMTLHMYTLVDTSFILIQAQLST